MSKASDSETVIIRPAVTEEAEAVWKNETDSWLRTYVNSQLGITEEVLLQAIEGGDGLRKAQRIKDIREHIVVGEDHAVFVACAEGRVVGSVSPFIDLGRHRLGGFHVDDQFQGQGIGSRLFRKSLEWNEGYDVWVHTISYNQQALAYYEKRGFLEVEHGFVTSPKFPDNAQMPILKMILTRERVAERLSKH